MWLQWRFPPYTPACLRTTLFLFARLPTPRPLRTVQGPTLSAVKYQVCRLMRMLVELTQTLEQVPEERYLFIKVGQGWAAGVWVLGGRYLLLISLCPPLPSILIFCHNQRPLVQLTYTDDTPEDYEPPMFAPAADGGVGCFSRMPFVMWVQAAGEAAGCAAAAAAAAAAGRPICRHFSSPPHPVSPHLQGGGQGGHPPHQGD